MTIVTSIVSFIVSDIINQTVIGDDDDEGSVVAQRTMASAGSTEHYAGDTDWYAGDVYEVLASAGSMQHYAGDNNWYSGDL